MTVFAILQLINEFTTIVLFEQHTALSIDCMLDKRRRKLALMNDIKHR